MQLDITFQPDERALQDRPKATAPTVEDLVTDATRGRMRVPDWQRVFRWELDDAKSLVDSIYRGYPIGTLLFWKREAPAERVDFGSVAFDTPARSDALYVVDGQQRITSLVRVLAGAGAPLEPFALFFDLSTGDVVSVPSSDDEDRWLPMTEVLDSRRLLKWLLRHPKADQDRAIDLGRRVREYQVPAYIVDTDREEAVRDIYERTNFTGRGLEAHEVFDGQFLGRDEEVPSGLRDVAEQLSALGFGRLDKGRVHTMMLATRTTDVTKENSASWAASDARAALNDVLASGRRSVSFLMHGAGIPSVDRLPYSQPLLTLSRFFHRHPRPHPRNLELLARWLWRGATAGLHSGASVGTRATLEAIGSDEDATVQDLLGQVERGRTTPFDPQSGPFLARTAKGKIGALAMYGLAPVHLVTGAVLEPAECVPRRVSTSAASKSSIGNRILHPQVAGGLRAALSVCADTARLATHAVSPSSHRLLLARDVDGFIEARESVVVALVEDFVRRKTCWEMSDRPPLRAFWSTEE